MAKFFKNLFQSKNACKFEIWHETRSMIAALQCYIIHDIEMTLVYFIARSALVDYA